MCVHVGWQSCRACSGNFASRLRKYINSGQKKRPHVMLGGRSIAAKATKPGTYTHLRETQRLELSLLGIDNINRTDMHIYIYTHTHTSIHRYIHIHSSIHPSTHAFASSGRERATPGCFSSRLPHFGAIGEALRPGQGMIAC